MGRLDTSKAAQLRVMAENLRRRARDMTLLNYIDMMERAALQLDEEAQTLEHEDMPRPGRQLDIRV